MSAKNKGLSNRNKSVKPSARNFKSFRESKLWVEHNDGFVVTLEAQNLTNLVDKHFIIVDPDLNKAQSKFMCKAMKENFLHCEAKAIVKRHNQDKNI